MTVLGIIVLCLVLAVVVGTIAAGAAKQRASDAATKLPPAPEPPGSDP